MSNIVNVLIKQSIKTFVQPKNDLNFNKNFQKLVKLIGELKPKDLHLNPNAFDNIRRITATKVFANDLFEMVIFIIPPGHKLPLHDHPGMYGVMKILFGCVHLRNFTQIDSTKNCIRLVKKCDDQLLDENSHVCTFDQNSKNFHEITCPKTDYDSSPAAFLDILAPPYETSYDFRECTYYKLGQSNEIDQFELVTDDIDVWMDNFKYQGPTISL